MLRSVVWLIGCSYVTCRRQICVLVIDQLLLNNHFWPFFCLLLIVYTRIFSNQFSISLHALCAFGLFSHFFYLLNRTVSKIRQCNGLLNVNKQDVIFDWIWKKSYHFIKKFGSQIPGYFVFCILIFVYQIHLLYIDWSAKVNKNIYFLKRKTVVMEFCMHFDSHLEQIKIPLKAS